MSVQAVLELARRGRLYPAVILHGGDEGGRRQAVLELAQTLLCERAPDERPCGSCRHCQRIQWPGEEGDRFHPDFSVLERDLRTVTSVDATKAFLRGAQVAPYEAGGQVFVIANAETLSGEAANALLKTLEEPHLTSPRHFFLLTPSQLDLLPTLRSRSLSVFLGSAPRPQGEDLEALGDEFLAAVQEYRRSGNSAELLAAAALLKDSGSWNDPRATEPWERAAAAVVCAWRRTGDDRRLLDLAAELLAAPRMRVRGITAERILEGCLSRSLGTGYD